MNERNKQLLFIYDLTKELKVNYIVLVLIEKTNRYTVIFIEEYKYEIFNTLHKVKFLISMKNIKSFKA